MLVKIGTNRNEMVFEVLKHTASHKNLHCEGGGGKSDKHEYFPMKEFCFSFLFIS